MMAAVACQLLKRGKNTQKFKRMSLTQMHANAHVEHSQIHSVAVSHTL